MGKTHGQKKVNTKIVISELHRAFKLFNEELFDGALPEPAILIAPRGNKKLTLGWCTVQKVWKNEETQEEKYEINICAEALNRGIYPVMSTLLHEMVHLHNLVFEIKDVSRGGTYHNMKFKRVAEEHGLLVEHEDKIGWSLTKLQGTTMDLIDSANFDEAVFKFGRRDSHFDEKDKPRKKVKSSVKKYTCPTCGCIIRATKLVNVICGDCLENSGIMSKFVLENEPDTDENDNPAITIEPTDYTPVIKHKYVCKDCGSIFEAEEGCECCIECGSNDIVTFEEYTAGPVEVEPAEVTIEEEPTQLDDGAGNMVDVMQGKFIAETGEEVNGALTKLVNKYVKKKQTQKNTGWDISRIGEVIHEAYEVLPVPYNMLELEITDKLKSQYANYKEGKKIRFSEEYMKEASDEEIIDTIKHEYLHHYQYMINGQKVNHGKEFKALCEGLGISTEVPTKNHRAMK